MYAMQASCSLAAPRVALSSRRTSMRQLRSFCKPARRAASLVVKAEDEEASPAPPVEKRRTGFVDKDNSGSANIFAIEPETVYISSPERDERAKEGLGGIAGAGGLLLAVVGVGAGLLVAANGAPDVSIAEYSWDAEALEPLSYYLQNL